MFLFPWSVTRKMRIVSPRLFKIEMPDCDTKQEILFHLLKRKLKFDHMKTITETRIPT